MTAQRLAEIKARWEASKCSGCHGNRTLMLANALPFVYEDAAELFGYIDQLEKDLSNGTDTRTTTLPGSVPESRGAAQG